VVITDEMQMRPISARYGHETAIRQAILARADILLFANNSVYEEDIAARVASTIRTLVEKGEIPRERIDESFRRIMRLKERLKK
jgi:beta-N-acetylhexosaminidase